MRGRFLALEEGALRGEEAAAVRAHVGACDGCRRAWERWQADDRALRAALAPVPAPRDLAGAAVAQLHRGAASVAVPRRRVVWRWGLAAAAAALLVAGGAWLLLGKRYERIGQVALAEGEATARQRGARRASPLLPGAPVYNDDELLAGDASRLAVELYDRSRLAMGERTGVRLHSGWGGERDCGYELPHVCLAKGEVECDLESLRYFRAVGTPLGTAIVKGTRFRMKYVAGERVLLEVLEGEVLFSCPGGQVRVTPGAIWEIRGTSGLPQRSRTQTWN